jgi:predicted GNAT family acetyltransferase
MQVDAANTNVVHNTKEYRFEIRIGEDLCVLEYELRGQTIYFTHTGVPPALEGQGLANRLAQTGMDYARANSLKVVPACEFIHVFVRRHPQYQDLLRRL